MNQVHAVGENDTHRYIVMDRMGPSLEDLLTMCGNKLSVRRIPGKNRAFQGKNRNRRGKN